MVLTGTLVEFGHAPVANRELRRRNIRIFDPAVCQHAAGGDPRPCRSGGGRAWAWYRVPAQRQAPQGDPHPVLVLDLSAGDHKRTLEGDRLMTDRRIVFWILAVVGLAALPAGAWAQRDTVVDAACAEALSALQRGVQGDVYRRTVLSFYSCPDAGARALAAEWTHPPGDSLARRSLVAVSWNIQDRRIYDAVTQVVRNGSASRDLRLDAIEVLVGYFDQCLGIRYQTPELAHAPGLAYVALGRRYHGTARPGARPLPASVRAEVLYTLRQVGATDRDEVVGKIAAYLTERLAEKHDPLRCTGGMTKPRD